MTDTESITVIVKLPGLVTCKLQSHLEDTPELKIRWTSKNAGRGSQVIIVASGEDAKELAEYFKGEGEFYMGQGMQDGCYAEGRAMLTASERINLALSN